MYFYTIFNFCSNFTQYSINVLVKQVNDARFYTRYIITRIVCKLTAIKTTKLNALIKVRVKITRQSIGSLFLRQCEQQEQQIAMCCRLNGAIVPWLCSNLKRRHALRLYVMESLPGEVPLCHPGGTLCLDSILTVVLQTITDIVLQILSLKLTNHKRFHIR